MRPNDRRQALPDHILMKWKITDKRFSLKFIGAVVLLAGMGIASGVYINAGGGTHGAIGYEIIDGKAYPVMPEDSKAYNRDLRLYGGESAVFADELKRWWVGLWHGKSLAYTIAFITVSVSSAIFLAASGILAGESKGPDDEAKKGGVSHG